MTMLEPQEIELAEYRERGRPPIEETTEIILEWAKNYAYNGMELCRIVNGFDPSNFRVCHRTTKEKGWGTSKGGCKYRENECRICYSTLHSRLVSLHRRGQIRCISLMWFDGREPANGEIPVDRFRFWFINQSLLATKLIHDVQIIIGPEEYI